MGERLAPDTREARVGLFAVIKVDNDVVHEVGSHPWKVGDDGNAMGSEVLRRTNARQHEDLRGVYSTRSTTWVQACTFAD